MVLAKLEKKITVKATSKRWVIVYIIIPSEQRMRQRKVIAFVTERLVFSKNLVFTLILSFVHQSITVKIAYF